MLYGFSHNRTVDNLNNLLTYYEENKAKINKAFGCGKNIFDIRTSERPTVDEFIRKNKKIFENNLNKYLYIQFKLQAYIVIVYVMSRSDFQSTSTEFPIHIIIEYNRHTSSDQRHNQKLTS